MNVLVFFFVNKESFVCIGVDVKVFGVFEIFGKGFRIVCEFV